MALQVAQSSTPEILPPNRGLVCVVACPHPFRTERAVFEVDAGLTLAEILARAQPDPMLLQDAHVFIGDHLVPRDRWRRVRPKPGMRVTVRVLPGDQGGGGGKTALRVVLSIAIIAASIYFPPLIGLEAGTLGAAVVSAGIVIGGTLALNAIIPPVTPNNLLEGPEGNERPAFSIAGARNELRPYEPVPRVLGEHRMFPPKGAREFTEIAGDEQYLRALFVWGRGPLHLRDFKIGETPIEEFSGVEMAHRTGTANDPPLSLFSQDVFEEPLSILVANASGWVTRRTQANAESFSIDVAAPQGLVAFDDLGNRGAVTVKIEVQYAPAGTTDWSIPDAGTAFGSRGSGALAQPAAEVFNPAGDEPPVTRHTRLWHRVSMNAATGTLVVRAGQPSYWEVRENQGTLVERAATLPNVPATEIPLARVERRSDAATISAGDIFDERPAVNPPFGSAGDFAVSANGTAVTIAAGTLRYPTITLSAARASIVRGTRRFDVAQGQYDIRMRRITADTTDAKTFDKVFWTALRSFSFVPPIAVEGMATTELRIRATEQLTGVIDTFNGVATSILPDWNGTDWSSGRATSNPASLARYVLQGAASRTPLADSRLALADFEALHEVCTAAGRSFNAVMERHLSVRDTVGQILAAGRASFALPDNKVGVVLDERRETSIASITPRNSRGFSVTKAFPDLPHALRIPFVNRDQGWKDDELFVYRDGYSAANATRFERLDIPGQTDPGAVAALGRYFLAAAEQRTESYEVEMDIGHIVAVRGDMVDITHDVLLVGLGSGRIKSLSTDGGGDFTGLSADEDFTMEGGKSYAVAIRAVAGLVTAAVVTAPGTSKSLSFAAPVAASAGLAAGDLFGFGTAGAVTLEALVKAVRPNRDDGAVLSLIPHAPGVYDAADGPAPPFESKLTVPPGLFRPAIVNVRSDETVLIRDPDGSLRARILIDLGRPAGRSPGRRITGIEANIRQADGATAWVQLPILAPSATELSIEPVDQGQTYELRFRYLFEDGQGPWTPVITETVIGKSSAPPDPVDLTIGNGLARWSYPSTPRDMAGFAVRAHFGNNRHWPSATPAHVGLISGPPFDVSALSGGVRTVMVKAVDTSGNESLNAATLVLDLGDPLADNLVETIDIGALGFPGSIAGGSRSGGEVVADADGTQFWSGDDMNPMWSNDNATMWNGGYEAMTYDFSVLPDAAFVPADLSFLFGVVAKSWNLRFRQAGAESMWSDDAAPIWSDDAAPMWQPAGNYAAWPGRLSGATRQVYEFRLTTAAGPTQGRVTALSAILDVPDIREVFDDLELAPGGTRLPITKTYRRIKVVGGIALQDDGGDAVTVKVLDKDSVQGPLLRAFNAAGAGTAALIDATVQGY